MLFVPSFIIQTLLEAIASTRHKVNYWNHSRNIIIMLTRFSFQIGSGPSMGKAEYWHCPNIKMVTSAIPKRREACCSCGQSWRLWSKRVRRCPSSYDRLMINCTLTCYAVQKNHCRFSARQRHRIPRCSNMAAKTATNIIPPLKKHAFWSFSCRFRQLLRWFLDLEDRTTIVPFCSRILI